MQESDIPTEITLTGGEPIDETHYAAPRLVPENYPGEFPKTPASLIVGQELVEMSFDKPTGQYVLNSETGRVSLDTFLDSKGLPVMADRFPITVFGSNRCPGQLLDKFQKATQEDSEDLTVIPMATGTVKGFDVVYNAAVGNLGYFFGDLYQGPETTNTEIEVSIIYATQKQLQVINESEQAYDYTMLGEVDLGRKPGDTTEPYIVLPMYAHVGKAEVYSQNLNDKQQPVALSAIHASGRQLNEFSQADFQDYFFSVDPEGTKRQAFEQVSGNPAEEPNGENYRTNMKMRRAGGRHDLQKRKTFQAALVAATSPSERQLTDPNTFDVKLTKITPDDILPQFGHIAVINWMSGRR